MKSLIEKIESKNLSERSRDVDEMNLYEVVEHLERPYIKGYDGYATFWEEMEIIQRKNEVFEFSKKAFKKIGKAYDAWVEYRDLMSDMMYTLEKDVSDAKRGGGKELKFKG